MGQHVAIYIDGHGIQDAARCLVALHDAAHKADPPDLPSRGRYSGALMMWEALTDLEGLDAIDAARRVAVKKV